LGLGEKLTKIREKRTKNKRKILPENKNLFLFVFPTILADKKLKTCEKRTKNGVKRNKKIRKTKRKMGRT
jgi:hypothetical protein